MDVETAGETHFGHLARQMGKLMEQMQKGYFNYCPAETWTPAVNLYENDSGYLVCVDLSGVDKEKIDVVVSDGHLRLRGHRVVPLLPEGGPEEAAAGAARLRVHLMEIDHGPFCREVPLPDDVAVEEIHAQYLNGILWVELPKK
jgi:HSP20 family protein